MAVFWKELADHFNSKRFIILSILIYLASIFTIHVAAQNIRSGITETTQFIFLRFFTISGESQLFTFLFFLSFFIPIVGIALGFDAINSERASGNLSRLLSQPLYRDSVINGKFLAGLITLAILVTSIVLLVAGMGLRVIGVPPTAEEILRLVAFIIVSIIYGAFWMSLSVLFSVLFNRIATAALASIALWIFLFLFVPIIAQVVAGANGEIAGAISRISPGVLYGEVTQVLLIPSHPTMFMISMYYTGLEPNPLPLSQSLLIAWPQLTSLIGLTALCFAGSYIKFMREEIRST
ncbi:MAG: ABC transporter permease [Dehalococcoidia bacterium]|nr:ABC transporter permease [Dehalococcoidia bacterium]